MKIYRIATIVLFSLGLVVSCSSPTTPEPESKTAFEASPGGGDVLSVDSKGHLKTDATYDNGSFVATYRADGTYTSTWFNWDKATATYTASSGNQGTYVYDAKKRELTQSMTSYLDNGTWTNYAATQTSVGVENLIFASHNILPVYMKQGNSWVKNYTYTFTDSANTGSNYSYVDTESRVLDLVTGVYEYHHDWGYTSGTGPYVSHYKYDATGVIDTAWPAGGKFTSGKTVTFQFRIKTATEQSWDSAKSALGDAIARDNNAGKETYSHLGDCVVSYSSRASRAIER